MPTYFHGWRRKLGVVTLVMACAFMAVWVRSVINDDEFSISGVSFHSFDGRFSRFRRIDAAGASEANLMLMSEFGPGVLWVELATWSIPYWSIVIPLTILSAYLLLSKPRKPPEKI